MRFLKFDIYGGGHVGFFAAIRDPAQTPMRCLPAAIQESGLEI
jgi:hypothetical protein